MVIENNFFEKFFFEQTFNPIALYKIEPDIDARGPVCHNIHRCEQRL